MPRDQRSPSLVNLLSLLPAEVERRDGTRCAVVGVAWLCATETATAVHAHARLLTVAGHEAAELRPHERVRGGHRRRRGREAVWRRHEGHRRHRRHQWEGGLRESWRGAAGGSHRLRELRHGGEVRLLRGLLSGLLRGGLRGHHGLLLLERLLLLRRLHERRVSEATGDHERARRTKSAPPPVFCG